MEEGRNGVGATSFNLGAVENLFGQDELEESRCKESDRKYDEGRDQIPNGS